MYLIGFPLLLIPFVLYFMVTYLLDMDLAAPLFGVPLLAGRSMSVSTGDLLVLIGVFLLYIEILKATRLAGRAIIDHILSLLLFIAMIGVFVAVPRAATSTFLMLLALSCVDVLGGFTAAARIAKRDIPVDQGEHLSPGM